jgi:hypothetical protein
VHALFPGEPEPLPEQSGATWTVSSQSPPKPPPVRHADGYQPFVELARRYGTDPRGLFDRWAFAHFVRAHREALEADADLQRSAVVFLGNALIADHPACFWTHTTNGPGVTDRRPDVDQDRSEPERSLGVGRTVPALLEADEARFAEFGAVVDAWLPGAPAPRRTREGDVG